MIGHLLQAYSSMICDIVHTLPSLASIPLMAKYDEELSKRKATRDVKHHFQAFSQRCHSENATVVLTALDELSITSKSTRASYMRLPILSNLTRS